MQKRSCCRCQRERKYCCLTGDKNGHCFGLWQADLDEFLSFLTSGSYYCVSECTHLRWKSFRHGDGCWWHSYGRSTKMLQKTITGKRNAKICVLLKGGWCRVQTAHPTEPSSPPLIASSLFISYPLSLCPGLLAEMIEGWEGNKSPPKPLCGIQLSFLVGLKGKVSCSFCLFILHSCFKLHLKKYKNIFARYLFCLEDTSMEQCWLCV